MSPQIKLPKSELALQKIASRGLREPTWRLATPLYGFEVPGDLEKGQGKTANADSSIPLRDSIPTALFKDGRPIPPKPIPAYLMASGAPTITGRSLVLRGPWLDPTFGNNLRIYVHDARSVAIAMEFGREIISRVTALTEFDRSAKGGKEGKVDMEKAAAGLGYALLSWHIIDPSSPQTATDARAGRRGKRAEPDSALESGVGFWVPTGKKLYEYHSPAERIASASRTGTSPSPRERKDSEVIIRSVLDYALEFERLMQYPEAFQKTVEILAGRYSERSGIPEKDMELPRMQIRSCMEAYAELGKLVRRNGFAVGRSSLQRMSIRSAEQINETYRTIIREAILRFTRREGHLLGNN